MFYDREEAERAIRYAAQDEKLTVTGLRNGRGDRTYIPGLAWADLVFKFPLDSPTYATPWNDGSDALQWHEVRLSALRSQRISTAIRRQWQASGRMFELRKGLDVRLIDVVRTARGTGNIEAARHGQGAGR